MFKRFIISIALLAVIGGGAYIYWQDTQQTAAPGGFPPAVIASTEVKQQSWQPLLQSVGSLVATNGINVSTEVNGIISEIVVKSGQPVEQGQILLRLDSSVDQAALEALHADSKLTEIQFKRTRNLLKSNVISKSEYDEAEARYEAARARAKQQEALLKRKVIRAPFAGLVGIRQVSLGQYIEAGSAIVSLQALNPIYVDYTLAERHITRIKGGQTVNVKLDAIPGQIFSGEVSAVNSAVDVGTRMLKVRATLDNSEQLLRPGMFAEIQTITDAAQPVLTLPRTAISFNSYGNFVFVINKNEQGALNVKRTAVETGETRNGLVEIKGLPIDTQVVRAGLIKLRDGAAVKIDNQIELNDAELTQE